MYDAKQHRKMYNKLLKDHRLKEITDRFARMRYLVEHHGDRLARYGKWVMEQCVEYERKHCKSMDMADYYLAKADASFDRFAKKSEKGEYKELLRVSNNALCYMSYDWKDAASMARLSKLYVNRAKIEVTREKPKLVLSNLLHAYAAAQCFENDQIEEHFGVDLLASMVSLGRKLQEQLNITGQDEFISDFKENLRIDIDKATSFIKLMYSAFEAHQASRTKSPFKDNFKLNPKLRLNRFVHGGRFYQAKADIHPDEDILHDRGQSVVIFADHRFDYCDYCHRAMDTFWPCPGNCTELGYCSARCAQEAFEQYHHVECGIYGLMLGEEDYYWMAHVYRHYVVFGVDLATKCENDETNAQNSGLPFNFNEETAECDEESFNLYQYLQSQELQTVPFTSLSPQGRQLLCRAFTSLQSNRGKRSIRREHVNTVMAVAMVHFFIFKGHLKADVLQDANKYSQLLENLSTAMMRICTNGFCWTEDINETNFTRVASCVCLAASFLNHSCDANVNWSMTDGGLITMNAIREIQQGQPLTTSYGPKKHNNFDERQERLFHDYSFYCRCDVCLKDAAARVDTLKCPGRNGKCNGPLVPNQFNACLQCGQVAAIEQSQQMSKMAEKAFTKFDRIFDKLYSPKKGFPSTLRIGILNCASGWNVKPEPKPKHILDRLHKLMDTASESEPVIFCPDKVSLRLVFALEKQLNIFSQVIYEGSYHLLEKYVLMLKVYHDCNLIDRGSLHLIEPLSRLVFHLENITPSLIDDSLIKLVYMLDYVAYFYENFAISHKNELPYLVTDEFISKEMASKQTNNNFWNFNEQLNMTLTSILQYDMEHRGQFFPVAYRRLRAGLKEEKETLETEDEKEQYHVKVYNDSQRRLGYIEQHELGSANRFIKQLQAAQDRNADFLH